MIFCEFHRIFYPILLACSTAGGGDSENKGSVLGGFGVCILQRRRSKNVNAPGSDPNHPYGPALVEIWEGELAVLAGVIEKIGEPGPALVHIIPLSCVSRNAKKESPQNVMTLKSNVTTQVPK